MLAGHVPSAARLIRLIEDGRAEGHQALRELYPKTGRAHVVGVTGPPGAGKSTLVAALIGELRRRDRRVGVIAVDPAYTSRWGAEHWQKPLSTPARPVTGHAAASVAIGRRALGHRIRRRVAPPRADRSDPHGHRTVQAAPGVPGA